MIQFPEVAHLEWKTVAETVQAGQTAKRRLELDSLVEQRVEQLRINHEAKEQFQRELDAADTPPLEMMTLASYTPSDAPEDLIEGVMREEGLCVVVGPSGSGKSTLALQMCHSLLTGDDWLGQPVNKINGGVGVLSYDMDASMILNWMSGWPNVDPAKVGVVNAHRRGNPLAVPAQRAQIAAAWRAMNVEVVVLDSFSASFSGHDENDAAQTMAHYRDMKAFAMTEVGATALIMIAHASDKNPTKVRGSTVHNDTGDSRITVVPDANTGERLVTVEKYRDIVGGPPSMTPVILTAPDSVTHLVDVDTGAMTLRGLPIPPRIKASLGFTEAPEAFAPPEFPDTDSDEEMDDL